MPLIPRLANTLWSLSSGPRTRRFMRALRNPATVQAGMLSGYLRRNAATRLGGAHDFARIRTPRDFQQAVPVHTYESYKPYIEALAAGESNVLTAEAPRYFALSSGSASAEKWIPYTPGFLAEFNNALAPWISSLFAAHPGARRGPAYWSITPVGPRPERTSKIPVGFDDDAAYLGGVLQHLVGATLAAPSCLRDVGDMNAFRYLTLLALLRTRELALVSVWHPSFFMLLLDAAAAYWPALLRDLRDGTASPYGDVPANVLSAFRKRARANGARVQELECAGPNAPAAWWPHLAMLSAWADAHASPAAQKLQSHFPGVAFQAKGLLATEGVTTIPLAVGGETHYPLAVTSHFFEFLAADGTPRLGHELDAGATYTVVLTTASGLYRYNTGDQVIVRGRLHETPTLRFLGKVDSVSDLRGEKLNAVFVAEVFKELRTDLGRKGTSFVPIFEMLAPDLTDPAAPAYALFVELPECGALPLDASEMLDALLRRNPHYAYCRALGQLGPARVFLIAAPAAPLYLEACARHGQRLGNIKPAPLHRATHWPTTFPGAYVG